MAAGQSERGWAGLAGFARSCARSSERVCQTRGVVHSAVQDVIGEVSSIEVGRRGMGDLLPENTTIGHEKYSQPLFLSLSPTCQVRLDSDCGGEQDIRVIESFKHKGLARFFEADDRRKVPVSQAEKIARILARLNEAVAVQDMGLPGYRLHPLK